MIVRDAIHGDIEFTKSEERIINHKAFVRMKNIKQLGFVDNTFPCATHTRYQHSLGTAKCITDMYEAVCRNSPDFYRDGDLELLRVMALVHDLGHVPFSHACESLSTIEHEERLSDLLEYMKDDIIIPNNYNIPSWQLVNDVYQGIGTTYLGDLHLLALHEFMDNYIDADKLDYLRRDAYFCGVQYGSFDYMDLIKNLVMVDGSIGIKPDGLNALESFVLARYYMFNKVYTRPEERILRLLSCDEIRSMLKDGVFPEDVRKFITLDDTKYMSRLKCIKDNPFTLLYDTRYDEELKKHIERLLGDYLVVDIVRKNIFRADADDADIIVFDSELGIKTPSTKLSPLLGNIQYTSIHQMRFYTRTNILNEVKSEFKRILNKYNKSMKGE